MNPISVSPSAAPAASSGPDVCHPEAFSAFIEMLDSRDSKNRDFALAMLAGFAPTKEQEQSCIKTLSAMSLAQDNVAIKAIIEHLSTLMTDGLTLSGRTIPVGNYPNVINVLKQAQLKEQFLPLFREFAHTHTTKNTPPANSVARMAKNKLFEPRVLRLVAEFLV